MTPPTLPAQNESVKNFPASTSSMASPLLGDTMRFLGRKNMAPRPMLGGAKGWTTWIMLLLTDSHRRSAIGLFIVCVGYVYFVRSIFDSTALLLLSIK